MRAEWREMTAPARLFRIFIAVLASCRKTGVPHRTSDINTCNFANSYRSILDILIVREDNGCDPRTLQGVAEKV
jgi:hypothetical protein